MEISNGVNNSYLLVKFYHIIHMCYTYPNVEQFIWKVYSWKILRSSSGRTRTLVHSIKKDYEIFYKIYKGSPYQRELVLIVHKSLSLFSSLLSHYPVVLTYGIDPNSMFFVGANDRSIDLSLSSPDVEDLSNCVFLPLKT